MSTPPPHKMQHGKADHPYFSLFVSIGSCGLLLGFLAPNSLFWFSGSQILDTLGSTKIWQIVAAFFSSLGHSHIHQGFTIVMACKFTICLKYLPQSLTIKQFRFLRAFIYQVFVHREPLPSDALFRPLIVTTRNWPAECDYNIHKSNSTYFTDMDIARAHLVSRLLKNWLRSSSTSSNASTVLPNNLKLDGSKRVFMAVGAVSCHFRKEIPPFTKYEIWTRILCWDKKWIYIVCHFVKCGAVPLGQRSSSKTRHTNGNASATKTSTTTQIDPPSSAIYATGITRYVFKEGRITVPPELFLSVYGLLAPRRVSLEINVTDLRREMIEEENERGLKYMEAFATLDEVHGSLKDSTSKEALGHFGEF